jgi:uncharacterized protein (DUF2141 family)
MKFEDMNGNGVKDSGDAGLPGWAIYVDANNNSKYDRGERWTVTKRDGAYTLKNLAAGTYKLREIVRKNWIQTYPSTGYQSVTVTAGQAVTGKDFGNFKYGSIRGFKYEDRNKNGQEDRNAKRLSGWTIKLKLPDNTYITTVTDRNGKYEFNNLKAGSYVVTEVQQSGWTQVTTNPAPIVITSNKDVKKVGFGNSKNSVPKGKDKDRDDDWN